MKGYTCNLQLFQLYIDYKNMYIILSSAEKDLDLPQRQNQEQKASDIVKQLGYLEEVIEEAISLIKLRGENRKHFSLYFCKCISLQN